MWLKVSGIILRNKIILLTILAAITIFFGYHATKVEMSYTYASLLPKKDQAYKDYQKFVEVFGEDRAVSDSYHRGDLAFCQL